MPAVMGQPYPMEFLLTPGKVTIVIEAYTQVRHIYTDGRALPDDPDLKFHGTSVGRWEGNALVVDSIGFSPLRTCCQRSAQRQDADPRTLYADRSGHDDIETTVTDPDVLTAPFTTTRTLQRHRSWTIPSTSARKTIAISWTRKARPASVSTIRPCLSRPRNCDCFPGRRTRQSSRPMPLQRARRRVGSSEDVWMRVTGVSMLIASGPVSAKRSRNPHLVAVRAGWRRVGEQRDPIVSTTRTLPSIVRQEVP